MTSAPPRLSQVPKDNARSQPTSGLPFLTWMEFTVDLVLAEGDLVAGRWTARGTNTGRWGSVEPTGKRAEFSAVNIFRFANGKVIEIWNDRDDLGLRQQLGAPIYAGSAR